MRPKNKGYKKSGLCSEPNPDLLQQSLVDVLVRVKVEEHMAGRNPGQSNLVALFPS